MFLRHRARANSFRAFPAILGAILLFTVTVVHAQQEAGSCDRACLRQVLDAYLAGVFEHDPAAARLTDDHFATENTAPVRNGEGFWKEIRGYGGLQRRYFDPANGAAAYLGLLETDGKEVIGSVRIKVEGGKVSEAEWIVQRQTDPQRLQDYPPPQGTLPSSERSTRFHMVAMANNYFQSGVNHDGSWVPADLRCKDKEPNPISASPRRADLCHDNFGMYKSFTKDVALRRFPLVDEEEGVILGAAVWVRFAGVAKPDDLVNEYFQIRNGTFAYAWSCNYELPKGSPVTSGWEDRQGQITR
ncbi:MAG: hypothetical protein WDO56_27245 [Gammaproteobacteria bacterium]